MKNNNSYVHLRWFALILLICSLFDNNNLAKGQIWEKQAEITDSELEGFGNSIDVTPDGLTMVVGSSDVYDTGRVVVYQKNGDEWVRKGNQIRGNAYQDFFGSALRISNDGNIVAIGASSGESDGRKVGLVRVYKWIDEDWHQLGSSIYGDCENCFLGGSVDLSGDGKVLAVGVEGFSDTYRNQGKLLLYNWKSEDWVLDTAFTGTFEDERLSIGFDLSNNGRYLALRSTVVEDGKLKSSIKVFESKKNGNWVKKGNSMISDDSLTGCFGISVSMDNEGKSILVGDPFSSVISDGIKYRTGSVYFFDYYSQGWHLTKKVLGQPKQNIGNEVTINNYSNVAIIGISASVYFQVKGKKVEIYTRKNQLWTLTQTINNEIGLDQTIALTDDGNSLFIGNKKGIKNTIDKVSIYLRDVPTNVQVNANEVILSPNPSDHLIRIESPYWYKDVSIHAYDLIGKELVSTQMIEPYIQIDLGQFKGIGIIRLTDKKGNEVTKRVLIH